MSKETEEEAIDDLIVLKELKEKLKNYGVWFQTKYMMYQQDIAKMIREDKPHEEICKYINDTNEEMAKDNAFLKDINAKFQEIDSKIKK
jgi:hypothetical protein